MAKNKWLIVLLLLGMTGVLIYNIMYFIGRSHTNPIVEPAVSTGGASSTSISPPNAGTATSVATTPEVFGSVHPVISLDQMQELAKKTSIREPAKSTDGSWAWPSRDPFREAKTEAATGTAKPKSEVEPLKVELFVPDYKLSAILVQGTRRYAIIDGSLRKVDSVLKEGRVVAIEPDHVLVKTSRGIKRLDLGPELSLASTSTNSAGNGL